MNPDEEDDYDYDAELEEDALDYDDEQRDWRAWRDEDDYLIDGVGFAQPGGNSALRAATPENPRNLPCPTCNTPNVLTPLDRARGYQCDACADRAERGGW